MAINIYQVKSLIFGHAIGDALGVPVEFNSRESLTKNPVTDMRGFGTHEVPAGAWSDDTSMTLCLLESLDRMGIIDYDDIMKNFVRWTDEAAFTPTGVMFDIGRTTMQAIVKYIHATEAILCGGCSPYDNGNGSLMRIAPMALYLYNKSGVKLTDSDLETIHKVSALTHGHVRSQMACGIYVFIAVHMLDGQQLTDAVRLGLQAAYTFYAQQAVFTEEIETYKRLWDLNSFYSLPENAINSSGYVVDTLEAALWCLLNTNTYRDCVLKTVNLGEDTDTVAAVAGGLAGLAYGYNNIPSSWLKQLLRADYIDELCRKFPRPD